MLRNLATAALQSAGGIGDEVFATETLNGRMLVDDASAYFAAEGSVTRYPLCLAD